jgi:hypothetical protein
MNYLNKSFKVSMSGGSNSEDFAKNWDAAFPKNGPKTEILSLDILTKIELSDIKHFESSDPKSDAFYRRIAILVLEKAVLVMREMPK